MAITTLAQVISGLQPPAYFTKLNLNTGTTFMPTFASSWPVAGLPILGATVGLLGGAVSDNTIGGAIPFNNPPGGSNAYLARFQACGSWTGGQGVSGILLCDRLWHNGALDITSGAVQTINSVTFPARDINGSTNGEGVLVGVEFSVASSASVAATMTLNYTNSAGTAGRASSTINPTTGTSQSINISGFVPFTLAQGDTGVRQVNSLQLTAAWTSGTINLVAYRPIAFLDAEIINRTYALDASGGSLPRLYNGSCLFVIIKGRAPGSQVISLIGELQVSWG